MSDFSFIANAHPSFVESLYEKYQQDPELVEEGWRHFFKGFEFAGYSNGNGNGNGSSRTASATTSMNTSKEFGVLSMIQGFRSRGHLESTTNPIRSRRDRGSHLDLGSYGLSEADLTSVFNAGEDVGLKNATLQQIIDKLRDIYCKNIGFEYAYIEKREQRNWLRERIEAKPSQINAYGLDSDKKSRILEKLNGAVIFEDFLGKKYVGQKRFSLEGGETAIAALDAIINKCAADKVEEVVIGMAHRGRLNVLANIMGKTYEAIFNEFEEPAVPDLSFGDGDVKYHLGFSSQVKTTSGKTVHLKLVPNPSHLESVNTVVEGFARAKGDILYGSDFGRILPILIHGDAAIAGQGVMYETVQMSQLEGYKTGGTIHFVINNQIGFTTDFDDARSAYYCTSVAAMVQAPVFHVNGDDPEAVVFAVELAAEYRQKFGSDVFIDMVCYRQHGHNEGDDPKFTQPEMYKFIKDHPDPRKLYMKTLIDRGDLTEEAAEKLEKEFWNDLQARLDKVKQQPLPYEHQEPENAWRALKKVTNPSDYAESPTTGIKREQLDKVIQHLMTIPDGFSPLGKVGRLQKGKQKLLDKGVLDWGLAELLAYGSILLEGKDVRMSGQDVKRGTFSHRHAVFTDSETYEQYNRLNTIKEDQGAFRIYNSLLSEFGVLGFEYGYSLASPDNLVLWEAQFGDFYNGAQTIIDQYISAAESKWQRMSGLVMLLPHGYAGQGPEHSSARLERFLQMCAEYNMTVANISTPANLFHALRRQLARPFRKPLIIMSPKSLLRHPECVSPIEAFEAKAENSFYEYYDDVNTSKTDAKKIKRVLFCTGKVYYDLAKYKAENERNDVAICRIEQLYPFPKVFMDDLLKKYKNATPIWVQEEPENMGVWDFLMRYYRDADIQLVARKPSASPATGFKKRHEQEQQGIIDRAFNGK